MNKPSLGLFASIPLAAGLLLPQAGHAITTCNPGGYTTGDLQATGFSCQLGDKIYGNFSFTNFHSGARFGFDEPALGFHTFNGQSLGFGAGSLASYSYSVAVAPGAIPFIVNYQTSTSQLGGTISLTKTLQDITTPGAGSVGVPSNGGTSPAYSYTLPGVKGPITFSSTITVTSGTLTQFVDSVEQEPKIPPVPGPLPLLGAGAAFGFTRKLRKRISRSA
jgi:hypothetical protein